MKCTQFYPVLQTARLEETATFFEAHFRFRRAFSADWYIHLQSSEDESVNIALLAPDHETIPAEGRGETGPMLLN
ncbi:MAG: glyoxalase, partial [Pseudomonadota bacterium]